MYGDDKNLIAWGIEGDKLILKVVKDDIESVLYDSAFASKEIYLKLEVEQGCIFHFYKSLDGKTWQSVQNTPFKGKSLIRWDRVQRPGLLHYGDKDVLAEFSYFKMKNLK